jgi:Spy/CpxP family protein refolding chaperone
MAASVLALLFAGPVFAGGERHKWWTSAEIKAEIGLTDAQSRAVEEIFQAVRPQLRAGWEELDRLEREVARLMTEDATDENRISAAIDRTESARASLNKTRTLMLYRMYRVLSPAQRVKLHAIHERGDSETPGAADSHAKPDSRAPSRRRPSG